MQRQDLLILDQGAALQRRRLAVGEPISAGLRDRNAIAVRGVRSLLHGHADVDCPLLCLALKLR